MKWLLLLLSTVFVQMLFAQEALHQFEQANQLYRNGEYQQAVVLYEQIVNNDYEHAFLYFNLGNAHFKLKNIPAAILNYERAKRLAPHDEDILYNLQLANIRVIDKIEPIPQLFIIEWWRLLMGWFSSGGWAVTAIVAIWCVVISGTLLRFLKSTIVQRLFFLCCALSLLMTVLACMGAAHQYNHENNDNTAIIISPSVAIKSSPDEQSTDLFVLHEGVKVDLVDTVGEWKKIRLPDGKIGWVPAAGLQVI